MAAAQKSAMLAPLVMTHDEDYFPCLFPWLVFVVTLAIRVHYVNQPHNWWVVHPDEIFQSLEVAQSELYGYGFRPYEFMPPEYGDNITMARKVEMTHGLFALRSFLLPQAYLTVTWLLHAIGFSFGPFLAWKTAHTVVASTLPLAVFSYVTAVFRSHDTACLASILVASCMQMHVFGTHTLANSLLAPPVFLALTYLHPIIAPAPSTKNPIASKRGGAEESSKDGREKAGSRSKQQMRGRKGLVASGAQPEVTAVAGVDSTSLWNSRRRHFRQNNSHPHKPFDPRKDSRPFNGTCSAVVESLEIEYASAHECGGRPTLPACHSPTHLGSFLPGAVLGVCCYLRADVAVLGLATLLPHWRPFCTLYRYVLSGMLGALCGVGIGLLDDFRCYGWGVVTPFNWFTFNVRKDLSTIVFGENSPRRYIEGIFFQNAGVTGLCALSLVGALVAYVPVRKGQEPDEDRGQKTLPGLQPLPRTVFAWSALLLLYSCKGHKELRFVHNVIVLVLITCASAVRSALLALRISRGRSLALLWTALALFVYSQYHDVVGLTSAYGQEGNKMAFQRAGDIQDVNICLSYLSTRSDVTGVFIDKDLYVTGGYTLLQKNVSIFSFCNKNFHEFSTESRRTLPSHLWFGARRRQVSVAYFGHVSNYVSVANSYYVMKFVFQDERYNYLVVHRSHDLQHFGPAVFRHGSYKVYRRGTDPATKARLSQLAAAIAPVQNATVLEHEGDVLFHHGAWAHAAERFEEALRVQPSRASVYSSLAFCYKHLGNDSKFHSLAALCFHRFGREACQAKRSVGTL